MSDLTAFSRRGVLAGAAASILVSPVIGRSVYAQEPKQGGTLTIAVTAGPTAFDPHYGTGYNSDFAMAFTHEKLTAIDAGGNPVPLLATSWKMVDPTTWEFKLRQGVKFQDGTPFDAESVAWYFTFGLDPANDTAWRTELATIVDRVEAVDPETVRFHLKQPQSSFPVTLTNWAVGPGFKSRKAWEANGKEKSLRTPVGTGPFKLVNWSSGDRYEFERNPDYWQKGRPYVDKLVVRIIPEASVQVAALLAGEVDMVQAAPRHEVARLKDNGMVIVTAGGWQQEILWMNNTKAPFDNPKVRKAIAKGIDRQRIIDTLFFGTALPAVGGIPPWHWAAAKDLTGTSYDPAAAKALLAEAGLPNGFDTEILTSNRQPELKPEAELIQQMLSEIGVRAKIQLLEIGAWWDVVLKKPYEYQMLLGEFALAPDPHDFFGLNLASDNDYALSRPKIPELDKLLSEGRAATDRAERTKIYRRVQEIVDSEVPLLFLHHRELIFVTRPEVKGFNLTGSGYVFADGIWVDR